MSKSNVWSANWSGSYPNLCTGHWTLFKNDQKVKTHIPFYDSDAGTRGEYGSWYFGGDSGWDEQWDFEEDGLEAIEWIDRYRDWLSTFAAEDEFEDIFKAFQADDFRQGSCGGCI